MARTEQNPLAPRAGTQPYLALRAAKYVRDQLEDEQKDKDTPKHLITTPNKIEWLTDAEAKRLGAQNVELASSPAVKRQVRDDAKKELADQQAKVETAKQAIASHDAAEEDRVQAAETKRETLQRALAQEEARLEAVQGTYDEKISVVGEEDKKDEAENAEKRRTVSQARTQTAVIKGEKPADKPAEKK